MKLKKRCVFQKKSIAFWTTFLFIIVSPIENVYRVEKIFYLLGIGILGLLIIKKRKLLCRSNWEWILFVFYIFISCYWSKNPNAFTDAFSLVVTLVFLIFQLQFKYTKEEYDLFKTAFIVQGAGLIAICFMYGSYMDGRFWIQSALSTTDPNYLSGWFILPICFCVEYIMKKKSFVVKLLLTTEVALCFYFIFQSASRSGFIVNVFALVVSILYSIKDILKKYPGRAIGLLVLLIIVLRLGIEMLPDKLIERLLSSNGQLGGRGSIWAELLPMLGENPLRTIVGFGSGAVRYHTSMGMVAHNTFLDVLFNYGVCGLGLMLCFIGIGVIKKVKKEPYVCIAVLAQCILIFTLSALNTRFVMLTLFMLGAMITYETYTKVSDGEI